jgi:hypothetical protein
VVEDSYDFDPSTCSWFLDRVALVSYNAHMFVTELSRYSLGPLPALSRPIIAKDSLASSSRAFDDRVVRQIFFAEVHPTPVSTSIPELL